MFNIQITSTCYLKWGKWYNWFDVAQLAIICSIFGFFVMVSSQARIYTYVRSMQSLLYFVLFKIVHY